MRRYAAILVVGDEDLFTGFLERFPAKDYTLVFAADADEAGSFLTGDEPLLIVLDEELASGSFHEALEKARQQGSAVLGVTTGNHPPAEQQPRRWTVTRSEGIDFVADAASDILAERRRRPRVAMELPVDLGALGAMTATVVSGRSVFVPTASPLDMGATAELSVQLASGEESTCRATVVRVGRGDSGHDGMVLAIPENAVEIRGYLDRLVRETVKVEHGLQGTGAPAADAPPDAASGDAPAAPPAPASAGGLRPTRAGFAALKKPSARARARKTQQLVDELRSEIWVLKDEAVRHQARLAAALAAADKERDHVGKERDELVTRLHRLEASLAQERRKAQEAIEERQRAPATDPEVDDWEQEQTNRLEEHLGTLAKDLKEISDRVRPAEKSREPRVTAALNTSALQNRLRELRGKMTGPGSTPRETEKPPGRDASAGPGSPRSASPASLAATLPAAPRTGATLRPLSGSPLDRRQHEPSGQVPPSRVGAAPGAAPPVAHAPPPPATPEAADDEESEAPTGVEDYVQGELATVERPTAVSGPPLLASPEPWPPYVPPTPEASAAPSPPGGPAAPGPLPGGTPGEAVGAAPGMPFDLPDQGAAALGVLPGRGDLLLTGESGRIPMKKGILSWPYNAIAGLVLLAGVAGAVVFAVSSYRSGTAPDARHEATAVDAAIPSGGGSADAGTPEVAGDAAAPTMALAADAGEGAAAGDAAPVEDAVAELAADAEVAVPAPALDAEVALGAPAVDAGVQQDAGPSKRQIAAAKRRARRERREGFLQQGRELMARRQYVAAREQFSRALKMDDDVKVRELLALSHERAGELWPAIYHTQRAAKLSKRSRARLLTRAGTLYLRLKKKAQACQSFRAALKARASYGPAKQQLARHCGG